MSGTGPILPDAAERDRIVRGIGENLAVEAAAGSGKTTCLVGRLLTLAEAGEIAPGRLAAAVTFTRKAAAELGERFQAGIRLRLATAEGPARERLADAADAVRQCHIGTIHSFCGRLLRERPVEAGVDPDFRELDDEADRALTARAWDEFSALFPGGDDELAEAFSRLDLSPEDLREGFGDFVQYPDVGSWPGEERGLSPSGWEEAFAALLEYGGSVARYAADAEAEAGSDTLLPAYRRLASWAARQRSGQADPASLLAILSRLPSSPKPTQKCWKRFFGETTKTDLDAEMDRYARFFAGSVAPFLDGLRASRYAAALRCYRAAAAIHARLRHDARGLNFRDLLLKTAALLREYPEVRRDLSGRYARLLVDEVQDTDPIQAEILFLLAGDDPRQRDWRRCRPRPGALFMVGDPKQSIYRFTRADIATYALLKRLLVANGGEVLRLSVNFRSQPRLVDWINRTFEPRAEEGDPTRFPSRENGTNPAYTPLRAGAAEAEAGCFAGVYLLEIRKGEDDSGKGCPKAAPPAGADPAAEEAARIAGFIKHAVTRPLSIFDAGRGPRPAVPGDFLVATRVKKGVGVIAAALREAGIAARITGTNVFEPEEAPRLLALALAAALTPDNPILQVACLRSRLLGVSDSDLYAWRKAGKGFARIGATAGDGPDAVRGGLALLARCDRLFRDHDPVTALKAMADLLGLWPLSAADGGDAGAGALAAVFDKLTDERRNLPTPARLRERLEILLDKGELDVMPALGEPGQAVRIMNVHKAKGLEAPVVFLAGPPTDRGRPPRVAIDRSGETVEGRLGLYANGVLMACPPDWREKTEIEREHLAAERLRLSYVAATRAGSALVVSALRQSRGLKSSMIHNLDIPEELPEDYPSVPPPAPRAPLPPSPAEFAADGEAMAARLEAMREPTYTLDRAKREKGGVYAPPPVEAPAEPGESGLAAVEPGSETAMAVGEILHEMLEGAESPAGDDLERLAKARLAERGLPPDMAGSIAEMVAGVWKSAMWKRAAAAGRVFRELPFVMPGTGESGKPSLVRGVIDLAFEEKDGWVVVDYKSDQTRGRSLSDLAERHRGQLEAYAAALLRADPAGRIKEMGIYFLRAGEFVRLE